MKLGLMVVSGRWVEDLLNAMFVCRICLSVWKGYEGGRIGDAGEVI